jgi:CheY-like chemotaxis protein
LVDDSADDTLLVKYALQSIGNPTSLVVVTSGEEAMSYLEGTGPYQDRSRFPRPGLVLLDLRLGTMSGVEVLRWVRQHPTLWRLPVVVLSGSAIPAEIEAAYAAGANSYLTKPLVFSKLIEKCRAVVQYWFEKDLGARSQGK